MATNALAKLPQRPIDTIDSEAMKRPDVNAWLVTLQQLADSGNEEALQQISQVYTEAGVWKTLTGLQYNTELAFLDLMSEPTHLFTRKAIRRELNELRADLNGDHASALERILVDRIVACWLASHHIDTLRARKVKKGIPIKEAEYLGRQSERATRSLLTAIKTLATVRKLMQPTVQVNIADQQINVVK